jgi:RimJ/RimL family protein N-acetyltransferase
LYVEMYWENHGHLSEFMPEELRGITTAADGEQHIARLLQAWQERELFAFGAWTRDAGTYVGEAYLANPDWRVPSLELGYFVVAQQTRQGFATEAGAAVVAAAFEQFGVARLDLECRADNHTSAHVAERLGFRLEGRQRQRHRKRDGELVDRLWYGLLRGEWAGQRRFGEGTGR